MTNRSNRAGETRPDSYQADKISPYLRAFRNEIKSSERPLNGYASLLADLQHGNGSTSVDPCVECNEVIDIYVDAELANADVQQIYPDIWQHLQRCPTCYEHYQSLLETLKESRSGALVSHPRVGSPQLSFLQDRAPSTADPSLAEVPWRVWIHSWLTGEPFQLLFVLSPYYLHTWQVRTQPLSTRSVEPASVHERSGRALLVQTLSIGSQKIVVELQAHPIPVKREIVHLVASVESNQGLPPDLQVRLQWGTVTVVRSLPISGEVDLGEFPMTTAAQVLQSRVGTFQLAIEATSAHND